MTFKNAFSKLSLMAMLALPVSAIPVEAHTAIISGVPVDAIIMRSGSTAAKVAKIRHVPSLGVIDLKKRVGPRYRSEFDAINEYRMGVQRNYAGVKRLRAALSNNPATRRTLANSNISISRIVAVDVYSDGSLKVYLL